MVDPLFISDWQQVDKLARDVVTADFDQTAIEKEMKAAYSHIIVKTGKSDWSSSDNRFYDVQKIEQERAASFIIEYFGSGSPEEIAMMQWLRSNSDKDLQDVVDNPTAADESTADTEIHLVTSLYGSYPASLEDDPNATPYRSTNNSV